MYMCITELLYLAILRLWLSVVIVRPSYASQLEARHVSRRVALLEKKVSEQTGTFALDTLFRI